MLHVHSTSPLCNGFRLWAAALNSLTSTLAGLKWLSGTFPVKYLCQEYGNDLGKCHRVVRTCPGVVQYAVHLCSLGGITCVLLEGSPVSLVFVHGSCGFDVRGMDSMYGVLGMCR